MFLNRPGLLRKLVSLLETSSFGKLASVEVSAVDDAIVGKKDTTTVGHLRVHEHLAPLLADLATDCNICCKLADLRRGVKALACPHREKIFDELRCK